MEAIYKINLTQNELLWLLDSTSLFSRCLTGDINIRDMKAFRRKLLCGIVDGQANQSNIDLELSEDELWIGIEVAKSPVQVGSERVGMGLIRKMGKALVVDELARDLLALHEETRGQVPDAAYRIAGGP